MVIIQVMNFQKLKNFTLKMVKFTLCKLNPNLKKNEIEKSQAKIAEIIHTHKYYIFAAKFD